MILLSTGKGLDAIMKLMVKKSSRNGGEKPSKKHKSSSSSKGDYRAAVKEEEANYEEFGGDDDCDGGDGEGSKRDFTKLELKSDHANRPLWASADGLIFLEIFSPLYKQAYDFVIAITEPVFRLESMHEYNLTPHSLYVAVSVGVEIETIIAVLNKLSKTKEMICFIHAFTANHSKGKLILKNNRYMVESPFLEVLKRLLSDEWMERSDTFPVCDQYPVVSEVRQPLSSRIDASIILTGRLVDTNVDTCIPVRFRHSPTSIPYDTSLQVQSNNQEGSAKKNHPHVPTNNSEPIGDINLSNNGVNLRVPLLNLSNFQIYDWPDLKTKCHLSMVLMLPSDSSRQWHVHELELVELVADQVLGLEILEDDTEDITLQKARACRVVGSMSAMSGANEMIYHEFSKA